MFDIRGDGTPRRSYMYGVDLAAWLWAILARGQGARAYNVGSDEGMSILALAEMVAQAAGISSPVINVHGSPVPGAAPAWYVPDIARARDELGLTISVPAMEAIMRTLAWYREAGI
ncbi:MAG: hypothetical protein KDJ49_09565 [Alphaproteobacteria bacterium]|nr:hypothetical protein [Alphaproteobacteria bacterium]